MSEGMESRLAQRLARIDSPTLWLAALRAGGSLHWLARGHAIRRLIVSRYLSATPEPKLQIGTGMSPLPGWLNSDLVMSDVYLDLTRPLPLPDETFSYAFGEHVIEHLSEGAGLRLLKQLHRILKPGGVVRITTPDLEKIIALYERRSDAVRWEDYARHLSEHTWPHERPCQVFNTFMRHWSHRYIYDEDDLTAKLLSVGFEAVERCEIGHSRHPALAGVERHDTRTAEWINEAEAMSLEATRGPVDERG